MKRRTFLATGAGLAGGAFVLADPSRLWVVSDLIWPDADDDWTVAPPTDAVDGGYSVADASHLNRETAALLSRPTTEGEVAEALGLADRRRLVVTCNGSRHSMGGQSLSPGGLQLDLTRLRTVRWIPETRSVEAAAGATWRDVQALAARHGRSVAVMQDSNIFTVGGSLSVNAHGKDPRFGPMIETVESFRMLLADGTSVTCSPSSHADLFAAVIGGYGQLGIVTEARLTTTDDVACRAHLDEMSAADAVEALAGAQADPAVELIEAHLSIHAAQLLGRAVMLTYRAAPDLPVPAADLGGDQQTWLRKLVLRLSGTGDAAKRFRWLLETHVGPHLEASVVSRNTAMAAPVRFLKNPDPSVTEVLQEYFVPRERFLPFLARLGELVRGHRVNLLNVTLRAVRPDRSALLPYATGGMIGAVVYIQLHRTAPAVARLASFTNEVVEQLTTAQRTYYLCYGPYFAREQLLRMYPRFDHLVRLKGDLDPAGRFSSAWWRTVAPQAPAGRGA